MSERILTVRIAGDSRGGQKAMSDQEAAGDKLERRYGSLSAKSLAFGAAVGTGATYAVRSLQNIGAGFDDAYDTIAFKTGKTGDEFKALQGDFRAVFKSIPTDASSAGNAIAFVSSKLDLSGKTGQTVARSFLELSRASGTDLAGNMEAATDALNVFDVKGSKIPNTLDLIFRASQNSGMGFAQISGEVAAAATTLKPLGFGIDQTTALVASLGKAGISTSDVLPALGKSLAVAAKEGKPAQQVLADAFAAIRKAPDSTKAAGEAMAVFGAKAGPKFADLIRSGKVSYEQMLGTISKGDATIQKSAKATNDMGEKWTIFKNNVLLKLEGPASAVFGKLGSAATSVGPLMMVAGNTSAIAGAKVVASWIAQGAAATAGGAAVAAGWLASIAPIALAVAAVAGIAYVIVHNWDTIKSVVTGAVGAVVGFVQNHWPLLLAILTGPIGLAVLFITRHFDDIVGFVTKLPGRIAGGAKGMWNGISDAFKASINFIIRGWNALQFKIPGFKLGPVHFGGFTLGLPDIPLLAKGGHITSGGSAVVLDGNEPEVAEFPTGATVTPLSRWNAEHAATSSGPTVLEVPVYLNGREIARAIVDDMQSALLKKRNRNVSLGLT